MDEHTADELEALAAMGEAMYAERFRGIPVPREIQERAAAVITAHKS